MNNNDVLRRIRYAFDFDDSEMIALFALADHPVTREQVRGWLKKDDDPTLRKCADTELAIFLDGLINEKRGRREGPQPEPEQRLNNNIILRKLKIALELRDDGLLDIIARAGRRPSKAELSAFFRKPDHRHYRACKDQVLRNFLAGLALEHRADP